jgi:hypothetical protein
VDEDIDKILDEVRDSNSPNEQDLQVELLGLYRLYDDALAYRDYWRQRWKRFRLVVDISEFLTALTGAAVVTALPIWQSGIGNAVRVGLGTLIAALSAVRGTRAPNQLDLLSRMSGAWADQADNLKEILELNEGLNHLDSKFWEIVGPIRKNNRKLRSQQRSHQVVDKTSLPARIRDGAADPERRRMRPRIDQLDELVAGTRRRSAVFRRGQGLRLGDTERSQLKQDDVDAE